MGSAASRPRRASHLCTLYLL